MKKRVTFNLFTEHPLVKKTLEIANTEKCSVNSAFIKAYDALTAPEAPRDPSEELPPFLQNLKPECVFGYYRKKDGELNNTCYPQVRNPYLKSPDNKDLLKYCQHCDMKQKALIRYRSTITKPTRKNEYDDHPKTFYNPRSTTYTGDPYEYRD